MHGGLMPNSDLDGLIYLLRCDMIQREKPVYKSHMGLVLEC